MQLGKARQWQEARGQRGNGVGLDCMKAWELDKEHNRGSIRDNCLLLLTSAVNAGTVPQREMGPFPL